MLDGDGLRLAALLGRWAGERAGGVEERDDRHRQLVGQPEQALCLAEPLGVGRAEVPEDIRVGVGPLLVTDDHDRPAVEQRRTADDRRIVAECPVAGQLGEVGEDAADEVERPRTLRVPRQLDTRLHAASASAGVGRPGRDALRDGRDRFVDRHRSPRLAAGGSAAQMRRACWLVAIWRARLGVDADRVAHRAPEPLGETGEDTDRPPRPLAVAVGTEPAADRHQAQKARKRGAQIGAGDDEVDESVVAKEFGGLEAVRQLLADRARRDPRAGEADKGAWLGHDDVSQAGEAREHAAGGRVGEDADEWDPGAVELNERCGRLRELEQAERALLHARPARRGDDDGGHPRRERAFEAAGDLLTYHAAHRPAHEAEVEEPDGDALALDAAEAPDRRLAQPGLDPRRLEAVDVRLRVVEAERVERLQASVALLEACRGRAAGRSARPRSSGNDGRRSGRCAGSAPAGG